MSRITTLLFSSFFFAASAVGCGAGASDEQNDDDRILTSAQGLPGERIVSLESNSVPMGSCYFDGSWYANGYVYGRGRTPPYVHCSSKDGFCVAGPLAGLVCVASGDCYATCVDGTWEN